MNPDNPTPREELEARLTALLLGELSADAAAALRVAITQDAELAALHARLQPTVAIVRETAAQPATEAAEQSTPLRLSDERREKLLARFKTIAPKEFAQPQRRRREWLVPLAAAATVMILGALALEAPNFVRSKLTAQSNASINNLRQIDGAKGEWALETGEKRRELLARINETSRGQVSTTNGQFAKSYSIENLSGGYGGDNGWAFKDDNRKKETGSENSGAVPVQRLNGNSRETHDVGNLQQTAGDSYAPLNGVVVDNLNYIGMDVSGESEKRAAAQRPGNGNIVLPSSTELADAGQDRGYSFSASLGGFYDNAAKNVDQGTDKTATSTLSGYADTSPNRNVGTGDVAGNTAGKQDGENLASVKIAPLKDAEADKNQVASAEINGNATATTKVAESENLALLSHAPVHRYSFNPTNSGGTLLVQQALPAESLGLPASSLSSANPDVVRIENGKVVGVRRGTATVSATLPDNTTVSRDIAVESITPVLQHEWSFTSNPVPPGPVAIKHSFTFSEENGATATSASLPPPAATPPTLKFSDGTPVPNDGTFVDMAGKQIAGVAQPGQHMSGGSSANGAFVDLGTNLIASTDQLQTRTFKVDGNTFQDGLLGVGAQSFGGGGGGGGLLVGGQFDDNWSVGRGGATVLNGGTAPSLPAPSGRYYRALNGNGATDQAITSGLRNQQNPPPPPVSVRFATTAGTQGSPVASSSGFTNTGTILSPVNIDATNFVNLGVFDFQSADSFAYQKDSSEEGFRFDTQNPGTISAGRIASGSAPSDAQKFVNQGEAIKTLARDPDGVGINFILGREAPAATVGTTGELNGSDGRRRYVVPLQNADPQQVAQAVRDIFPQDASQAYAQNNPLQQRMTTLSQNTFAGGAFATDYAEGRQTNVTGIWGHTATGSTIVSNLLVGPSGSVITNFYNSQPTYTSVGPNYGLATQGTTGSTISGNTMPSGRLLVRVLGSEGQGGQRAGGGGGGFGGAGGGFSGGGARGGFGGVIAGASTPSFYPNATSPGPVSANIDPETGSFIVLTDDNTFTNVNALIKSVGDVSDYIGRSHYVGDSNNSAPGMALDEFRTYFDFAGALPASNAVIGQTVVAGDSLGSLTNFAVDFSRGNMTNTGSLDVGSSGLIALSGQDLDLRKGNINTEGLSSVGYDNPGKFVPSPSTQAAGTGNIVLPSSDTGHAQVYSVNVVGSVTAPVTYLGDLTLSSSNLVIADRMKQAAEASADKTIVAANLVQNGKAMYDSGKYEEAAKYFRQALDANKDNLPAQQYMELVQAKRAADPGSANKAAIIAGTAPAQSFAQRLRAPAAAPAAPQPPTTPPANEDQPAPRVVTPPLEPQPETLVRENAFSTFSLNVSDVAFKLAAATLEKGQMPDPGNVRSEEFINAFDYRDPEPLPGMAVGFAWERAHYPFAHNRDLLRFSVKTAAAGRLPGRPLNIVLLLDNSGSMERADRVAIIREALRVLAAQLQPGDKISVVTFARTARLWVDGISGDKAAQVLELISELTPEGGTNLGDALDLAYATALKHYFANGINRVVVLTDGAANLGNVDPDFLKQKAQTQRAQGIATDCFGIGWEGYNDDLLETLTRNGDGRYGFINSPEEAAGGFAAELAGALHVEASDVKVQVEFNPKRVASYRQIGYAKHQLTKEQFRDNTVHAAQIGAAEAGNGLYTVEVNPQGQGPICTVYLRYRDPGTANVTEKSWEIPYNGEATALEQSSPAMRLAATASAFSEWLGQSPYAGEVTPDQLLGYLRGVPEVFGADKRPSQLEWMIRQAKSITGK